MNEFYMLVLDELGNLTRITGEERNMRMIEDPIYMHKQIFGYEGKGIIIYAFFDIPFYPTEEQFKSMIDKYLEENP